MSEMETPLNRPYEQRQHRHRRLYWQVLLPLAVVLPASAYLQALQEGLLLSILGVLVLLLKKLTDTNDLLGYLGSLQRQRGN